MDSTYSLKLPPKSYRRTIEELSVVIPDPTLKLKFLKQAINEYQKISAPGKLDPASAEIAFQKALLYNAEKIWPGSIKAAKYPIHKDVIAAPEVNSRRPNKFRYIIGSVIIWSFLLWIGPAVSPLVKSFNLSAIINQITLQSKAPHKKIIIRKLITYSQPSNGEINSPLKDVKSAKYRNETGSLPEYLQNPILLALTPQKTQNSASVLIIQKKPTLLSKPLGGENHLSPSAVKSEKQLKGSELVFNYLQNPILLALTPEQIKISKSEPEHISPKSFMSSPTHNSGNYQTLDAIKPANPPKGSEDIFKYFQNPILLALASKMDINTKSDPFIESPLLSYLPPKDKNHESSPSVYSSVHRGGPAEVLKYFRNPILTALTSRQTTNAKPEQTSKKPLSPHKPQENENIPSFTALYSDELRKEPDPVLNHLQNPILLSLAPQQSNTPKSNRISKRLLAPLKISENENQSNSTGFKSRKYQVENGQIQKYLQDPILLALANQEIHNPKTDRTSQKPLPSLPTSNNENHSPPHVDKFDKFIKKTEQFPEYLQDPIWLVEKTPDREFYSNRLQIITSNTISNIPREYYRFPKNPDHLPVNSKITDKISGIVYHASESDLYPFMPQMNRSILKYSKRLIKFLQRKKSYHFFIDRFGRVYRLVKEEHAAFHAGNSIWADGEEIYLNLNHAFIGICFEGKDFEEIKIENQNKGKTTNSKATRLKPTGISSFNEAQLRSGKELTDWLRVKYKISQHNCVPHALISINPDKMLIGWHLDLCRGFPFAKFGLSNKYREPLPSIVEFGFRYDAYFKKIFNHDIWPGIRYSEEILKERAMSSDMRFAEYRESLHQRFSLYAEWNKKMLERKDHLRLETLK